ncbi:hypothetical protein PWG71_11270 [Nocardiopsis sp. N85]|uniref:hypothetical protein n=1 Tax=Nocardiopsis sp. N85 TaxID=3029400 RepID=UPI00237FA999|nr:hypothetical protein [Nocardiopsis sp. N85]MDE3721970.1 hypothetical protein [Nocardiopsis sp. N85]
MKLTELYLRVHHALTSRDDDGYSTETVIITAVLVGIALLAVAAIRGVATEYIGQIGTPGAGGGTGGTGVE